MEAHKTLRNRTLIEAGGLRVVRAAAGDLDLSPNLSLLRIISTTLNFLGPHKADTANCAFFFLLLVTFMAKSRVNLFSSKA